MKAVGIAENVQNGIWRTLSGIYNLGNIIFEQDINGYSTINSKDIVDIVSELWGIEYDLLKQRLITSRLIVCKSKPIYRKIPFNKAIQNRDSIAKGVYYGIFLHLIDMINNKFYDKQLELAQFIAIIDFPGFDPCSSNNSLEKLCVNFANEKLQQFFNYHMIEKLQQEFNQENVKWNDNMIDELHGSECVDMIENIKYGFYSLLDSQCKCPRPSIENFVKEFNKYHTDNSSVLNSGMNKKFEVRKIFIVNGFIRKLMIEIFIPYDVKYIINKYLLLDDDTFIITHYFGKVSYDILTFLPQNMESIHFDTVKKLKKSKFEFIKNINWTPKGRKKKSMIGYFHKSMKKLMKTLNATDPYFIHCIHGKDENIIKQQLKCNGIIQVCKILKYGYFASITYKELYKKFYGKCRGLNPLLKNSGDLMTFSQALLAGFDLINGDKYALGKTKIFFKYKNTQLINLILTNPDDAMLKLKNDKITSWIVNRRINQIIGICKILIKLKFVQ